jgi:hypothetical protein
MHNNITRRNVVSIIKENNMSFTTIKTTQKQFLESYLRGTDRSLTSRQADSLYGIKNLRARITELRQSGLVVRTDKTQEGLTKYMVSARDLSGSRARMFA